MPAEQIEQRYTEQGTEHRTEHETEQRNQQTGFFKAEGHRYL